MWRPSRDDGKAFLRHPLVLSLTGALVAAVLIPQFTRQWSDRQKEEELKQGLIDQASTTSTRAVMQAIALQRGQVRAAGGQPGENPAAIFSVLKNSWKIDRAGPNSTLVTYFPRITSCWASHAHAIDDYISLGDTNIAARQVRISAIRSYVESQFARTYDAPHDVDNCVALDSLPPSVVARYGFLRCALDPRSCGLAKGSDGWRRLALPTTTKRFRGTYAILGELLLIGNERIVVSIVKSQAEHFSHGVHL